MPVVADQDPDPTDRGVPHRVAEVAWFEIKLLPKTGADVRDVRLAVLAQHRAVVLDEDRGVVVDAGLRLLVERHDQRHLVLLRQRLHPFDGRAVVPLGGVVPLDVLLGAEVGTKEDPLQAGDLRTLGRRFPDQLLVLFDRFLFWHVRVRLDQRRPYLCHVCVASSCYLNAGMMASPYVLMTASGFSTIR